jgi:ribulose-5-phosphate 4-epimerase/fuculose-1-phosphate aldolase
MIERINEQNFSHICYISREINISEAIVDILSFAKTLNKKISSSAKIIISVSFGNRLLLSIKQNNVKNITQDDIIEIIDIDPIKKNVLLIGKKPPCIETLVHWIIHKARPDINAVVEIQSHEIYQKYCNKVPILKKTQKGTIEQAKTILQSFQKNKNICIENETIILSGIYLKEIEEYLIKNFEDI